MFGLTEKISNIIAAAAFALALIGGATTAILANRLHIRTLERDTALADARATRTSYEVTRNSLDTVTGLLAAKNAESDARGKALVEATAAAAADDQKFAQLRAADQGRTDTLNAIAAGRAGKADCNAPGALISTLKGL